MNAESCLDGVLRLSENSFSLLADMVRPAREMDDSHLAGTTVTSTHELTSGRSETCMVDVKVRSCEAGVAASMSSSASGLALGKRKRGRPPSGQAKTVIQPKLLTEEEDVCFICFDGGSLVLCDRRGCPKAYHPACIKRDESFFRSKAKWNCGWHICSTCQKASSYMCYTCTYSLCKGCTRNADFVAVRGCKGFCGTCMRTVCLIENIGLTNGEKVQVDFDDRTSWEYLFKVYWMCLKTKHCLNLDELIKAKNPWKGDDLPKVRTNGVNSELHRHSRVALTEQNHSNSRVAWATKELMDFVTLMRNGDVSVMSQFDVQALLLDYIKKNNLRDPRQKSHIICDSRLVNLFGKGRVGHFEMLKLLEYHFLVKENSKTVREGAVDTVSSHYEAAGTNVGSMKSGRRRKSFRKPCEEGVQISPNADDFAAVDVHNINLLYLKRNLMETLLDDVDNFPGKVIGSFVRIKISEGDQKFDAYRLVRVVGTSKSAELYTVGSRKTTFMLEILNLAKKEVISIESISCQEFSEDECRRLRQSIKCGLVKRLLVGEIMEKALMLQAVKVNDILEMEVQKLNHLRDRASEKGQRKQLRECIEKLELLSSPKERERRLQEIPKVHTDPKMNPSYVSDDELREIDGKKQGGRGRPKPATRKGYQASYMVGGGNTLDGNGSKAAPYSQKLQPPVLEHSDQVFSDSEAEKLWHYQDPSGKIQGPFAMIQLRKWSLNGLLPLNLRVWRTYELQNDSILLTDALVGRFVKELPFLTEVFSSSTNDDKKWDSGGFNLNYAIESGSADSRNVDMRDKTSSCLIGSDSPSWTTSVVVSPVESGHRGWQLTLCNKSMNDQTNVSGRSSSSSSKVCETLSSQTRKGDETDKMSLNQSTLKHKYDPVECRSNLMESEEKRDENEVYSSHSAGWIAENETVLGQQLDRIKTPVSHIPVMDSGISWNVTSSLVGGEWCGYSPTKPSIHQTVDAVQWQPLVSEVPDNDFSMVDESVSDLLAEVEAMESLGGMSSPISRLDCVGDFTSVEEFSPLHDEGKHDSLSNLVVQPLQLSLSNEVSSSSGRASMEPVELPLTNFLDPSKRSSGLSSSHLDDKETGINSKAIKENSTLNRLPDINRYNAIPYFDNRGDRSSGLRDNRAGYQGRELGFLRDSKPSLSRPQFLGLGNGSHSSRPPPKGQRVCKYYESGYCRKGASCTYWHPGS